MLNSFGSSDNICRRNSGSRIAATCSASGLSAILRYDAVPENGFLAALQAQEHADRTRRHHRPNVDPGLNRVVGVAKHVLPDVRPGVALRQGIDAAAPRRLGDAAEHREFFLGIRLRPLGDDLEEAGAGILHAHREAGQLRFQSAQGRRVVALETLVAGRTRGGDAEGPGANGVGRDLPHLGDVALVRRLEADGTIAHHVDAHGGVGQQGADVDVARPLA